MKTQGRECVQVLAPRDLLHLWCSSEVGTRATLGRVKGGWGAQPCSPAHFITESLLPGPREGNRGREGWTLEAPRKGPGGTAGRKGAVGQASLGLLGDSMGREGGWLEGRLAWGAEVP